MHATVLRRPLSAVLIVLLVFTMLPLVSSPPAAHAAVPPASSDYNSVVFVDDMWGWVAGTSGTILRTRNGGDNWEILDTPTTDTFVAVSFVDRNHGWAATVAGRVYRTTDGGASWLGPSTPRWRGSLLTDTEGIVYDLHFVSTSTGFLTARGHVPDSGKPGVPGIIYRTTDGGIIWTRVFEGPDYSHQDDPTPEGNSILRGIDFVSATHGWVVGVDRRPIPARSIAYRTTDGGGTWTSAGSGLTGSADLYSVSFANTQVGLAVGSGGAVRKTTDSGATWTAQNSNTSNTLRDVFMLDTQNAWAVGDSGTVRRTTNGGSTWTSGWAQETTGISLRSVQVMDSPSLKGWLTGSGGRIRITTDGQNWYAPAPDLSGPGPEVTGLSSTTHPDQDTWYSTPDTPVFIWDEATDEEGVEGYSVSWSTDSQAEPDDSLDLDGSSSTTWSPSEPMTDGIWYFQVKAKNGLGNWGSPSLHSVRYATGDTEIAPTVTALVINEGALYTDSTSVQVSSSVSWGPSGPGEMRFSTDGKKTWGSWREYATPAAVTLPSGAGVKTVTAEFRHKGDTVSATRTATIELLSSRETPIAGSNRYDTAVKTSVEAYPDGLSTTGKRTVVIATGQNWPDALGGSALAGAVDGPILLVEPGSVPAAVSRELTRLGARNAIIVGGEAAVSKGVEDALNRQLAGKVERLAGSNRYLTADRIASRAISELGTSYDGKAFVATGGNFPDALAAAPLAAANGWPLFLSDPSTGRLPASSLNAMKPRVKSVVILGGTAVVPAGVETTLNGSFGSNNVTRLAGSGRYDTARQVAAYGVANSDLSWARVGISTGTNFPDALAGGVLMGKVGGVVLLTESHRLSGETSSALSNNRSRIMNVTYFGGTSAVSEAVRTQVRSALRW